jgi:subtilisin family serine protease
MNYNNLHCPAYVDREVGWSITNDLSAEEFKSYYFNQDYEAYFIEFKGDILTTIANIDYAKVYIPQKFFALLFVRKGMLETLLENVPEIINIERNFAHILSELVINNEATPLGSIYEGNIPLDGEGVIVGIIGTGIDYLNPRFMTESGESRIVGIWDETITSGPAPNGIPFGTEYNKEKINEAIRARNSGGNPYEIVPHRDEVGHGTAIAGLIGGRPLDEPVKFKAMTPKCEYAIAKLQNARRDYLEFFGAESSTVNAYQLTSIVSSLMYLSNLQAALKKPMVVYLPLGSNFGSRDGSNVLERFIDTITNKPDFSIVTETGNQGMGYTHASGLIRASGQTEEVFIYVGTGQRTLSLEAYTKRPNVISIGVTSPSGNTITGIPVPLVNQANKYITVENDEFIIDYLVRENVTGTVSVNMVIRNTTEGIWKISLFGEVVVSGIYDLWIPLSEFLIGGTRFLTPSPYTTLLTPCSSANIIVTAYYNQIDNTIIESSGKGFPRQGIIKPSFSTRAVNFLTVGLNNSLVIGSSGAMAGAIAAGAVALIYQWGIVQKKYPMLAPPLLKNLLIASTDKDPNIVYPNREWGYGKLNINKLYEVMLATSNRNNGNGMSNANNTNINTANSNNNTRPTRINNQSKSYLYINIPLEVYKNLNLEDRL